MTRARSANISDKTINKVVAILDSWTENKLTWDLLIDALKKVGLPEYTRQAIERHERIKGAYGLRKLELRTKKPGRTTPRSPEAQRQARLIESLETKVTRLEMENINLLEQFRRWAYNASNAGLTEEQLNRPLPSVNRGQSTTGHATTDRRRRLKAVAKPSKGD